MAGSEAPRYVSQQELPDRGASAIIIPPLHTTVAAAAGQTAGAAEEMFQRLHTARVATIRANAESDYLIKLDQLRDQFTKDPDWQTAPQRFAVEHAKLDSETMGRLDSDPEAQARMRERLTRAYIPANNAVQRAALANQFRAGPAALDTMETATRAGVAKAASPVERRELASVADEAIGDQQRAGIISAPAAAARRARLARDISTDDARAVIAADPDKAATAIDDPENFPGLDIARRVTLANEANAAAAQRDVTTSPAAFALGGLALAREGKLDHAWLADHEPLLTATAYGKLAGMIAPAAPPRRDVGAYHDLLDRATDGEQALYAAADAYRDGRLDKAAFDHVYDVAQKHDFDRTERPWAIDQRRDLVAQLAPSPRQDPDQAWRQVDGAREYEAWLDGTPDATADEGASQVRAIADKYRGRAAENERASLPTPRYLAVPRDKIDGPAIAAAADRMRDAWANGRLDDEDFAEEVELMQAWQDVIGREGKR